MKEYILKMYPGEGWKHKVNSMPDRQIMAVYFSMKHKGQQPVKESKKEKQLTIFDYDEEGRYITGR